MEIGQEFNAYPPLSRRIKAALIDGIIIPCAAIGILVGASYAGVDNSRLKIFFAVSVIFLLEPFAVAYTGGSIGHHLVHIRVRKQSEDKFISLGWALIRFLVKTLIGIPAFFVALITKQRQALHDIAAKSIVIYESTQRLSRYKVLSEISREDEHRYYSSLWRRFLIVTLYWVVCYLLVNLIAMMIFSGQCFQSGICSETEIFLSLLLFILMVVFFGAIVVFAWKGSLYGCRKQS
jgi:uncharacterized RDD family membrane protein YckC